MAPVLLLINVSKVIGFAGIIGVAANAFSYHRYRKRNLAPFDNPIDEQQDVLAVFPIDRDVDDGGFFFALATAPAHVEDKLEDSWLQFAKETPPKEGNDEEQNKQFFGPGEDPEAQEKYKEVLNTSHKGEEEGEGLGSPESPKEKVSPRTVNEGKSSSTSTFGEWEVIGQAREKDRTEFGAGEEPKKDVDEEAPLKARSRKQIYPSGSYVEREEKVDQSLLPRSKGTTEDPLLQFNLPKKGKKVVKIAMEAMIRGYEKLVEDDKPNVAAWHNASKPEQRVRFWSDPDTEIKLAQGTNIQVFRMGVDWTRIMPVEPVDGLEQAVDWAALDRYRHIIERVRAHGMQVMLTLFHHSLPPWAGEYGGWKLEKTIDYFVDFTRIAVERFSKLVDYWITFNEPHVFAMLTYCAGAWPGGHPDLLETATSILPQGVFNQVMHKMAIAHTKSYDIIHDLCKQAGRRAKVGVSHHVSFTRPYGLFDTSAAVLSDKMTRYAYVDDVCHKLDFVGINYYGQEVVSAPGLKLVENDEYSESGRGVYPDGLYRVLVAFHDRYKHLNLPYIITENGVSDATDYIRRPYLLEHLLAVRAAMDKGVRVQGYCFWTTSDNWEWADGYGPKFGLAAVDREHDLKRMPRPSYYLFSEVARTGKVTKAERDKAWAELQTAAAQGRRRPFYRALDKKGLMYAGGLDIPIERPFVQRDWRFGHYEYDGLQDPLSRLFRSIGRLLFGSSGADRRSYSTHVSTSPKTEEREEQEEEAASALVATA